ncbi:MAG: hypothetical protein MHPSP_001168, partial [Paramarteilia canceri]
MDNFCLKISIIQYEISARLIQNKWHGFAEYHLIKTLKKCFELVKQSKILQKSLIKLSSSNEYEIVKDLPSYTLELKLGCQQVNYGSSEIKKIMPQILYRIVTNTIISLKSSALIEPGSSADYDSAKIMGVRNYLNNLVNEKMHMSVFPPSKWLNKYGGSKSHIRLKNPKSKSDSETKKEYQWDIAYNQTSEKYEKEQDSDIFACSSDSQLDNLFNWAESIDEV